MLLTTSSKQFALHLASVVSRRAEWVRREARAVCTTPCSSPPGTWASNSANSRGSLIRVPLQHLVEEQHQVTSQRRACTGAWWRLTRVVRLAASLERLDVGQSMAS